MSDLIVIGYPGRNQLMKALHGDDRSAPTWEQPQSAGAAAS
jgi:hypothetical protein